MTAMKSSKTPSVVRDYYELGKPRITMFVCMTAMAAFYLASTNGVAYDRLFFATVGTYLVSFGSCAFNQIIEVKIDQHMHRTQNRALPTQRIPLLHAWIIGIVTTVAGLLVMYWKINVLSMIWLFLAWCGYVLFYTPLKVRTTFNTIVGSFVGALPPIIGWVAARGRLSFEGVVLFLILFFWQLPHFLAISWMYKEDYERANVKMITGVDPGGILTPRQAFLNVVLLFPVVLLPFAFSMAGYIYLMGSFLLTIIFTKAVIDFWKNTNQKNAKLVLLTSIIYLPAVFLLLVMDKVG